MQTCYAPRSPSPSRTLVVTSLTEFVCFEYSVQLDELQDSFRVGYVLTRRLTLLRYGLLHFIHLLGADAIRKLAKAAGVVVGRGATNAMLAKATDFQILR